MTNFEYSLWDTSTGGQANLFVKIDSNFSLVKDFSTFTTQIFTTTYWLTPKYTTSPAFINNGYGLQLTTQNLQIDNGVGLTVRTDLKCDSSAFDPQNQFVYIIDVQQQTKCTIIPTSSLIIDPAEDISGSDYTVEAKKCDETNQIFSDYENKWNEGLTCFFDAATTVYESLGYFNSKEECQQEAYSKITDWHIKDICLLYKPMHASSKGEWTWCRVYYDSVLQPGQYNTDGQLYIRQAMQLSYHQWVDGYSCSNAPNTEVSASAATQEDCEQLCRNTIVDWSGSLGYCCEYNYAGGLTGLCRLFEGQSIKMDSLNANAKSMFIKTQQSAPKLQGSQLCLDDTYRDEVVDEFFLKVTKRNSYQIYRQFKVFLLNSSSFNISLQIPEIEKNYMTKDTPYLIAVSELEGYVNISQSIYQETGLVFSYSIIPQLFIDSEGSMVPFHSQQLLFDGNFLKLSTQMPGIFRVFIKYQLYNRNVYLPFKSYVCAFESHEDIRPLYLEYTVAWFIKDQAHRAQKILQLFENNIPGCQIQEIILVKDETGARLDLSSGLGLVFYDKFSDHLVVVRNDRIGEFNLMIQAKNAGNMTAFYPIKLKLMPNVNKMPAMEEELASWEVTVNQQDQIEGKDKIIEFKSPTFIDQEGDKIIISITGYEANIGINCDSKSNFFVCQIDTSEISLANSGTKYIQITVTDDGSSIREPNNVIDFVIRITYIEFLSEQQPSEKQLSQEYSEEVIDITEDLTPQNAREEALLQEALEAEKDANRREAEQARKAAQDEKEKASGKDEVITEVIPTLAPVKPPGVTFVGLAQMTLLMDRLKNENEKAKAKKLEKLDKKEIRPVLIQESQLSKSGRLKIEFNQPLEIPSVFKSSDGKGRRLLQLENIDPSTIIDVNMQLLSDVSPRDLSYYMVFKEWAEKYIEIQIDFNNPLLLSSGPTTDKLNVEIRKPEFFVSKESGLALDLTDEGAQISQSVSIPNQLPKDVSEESLTQTAKYGSRGATAIVISQICSQVVMKGSSKDFEELIFEMQVMVFFPYYSVDIPANVLIYIDQIRALINFEMLNPEFLLKLYDKDLTMDKLAQKLQPNRPDIPKSLENSGSTGDMWQDLAVIYTVIIFFLIFVAILAVIKKFCVCNPKLQEFAKNKFESLKEVWLFNGLIQAFAFTFLNQTAAVGSKIIQMSLMEEVDFASKLGVIVMMTVLILYLIIIFVISWMIKYQREIDDDMSMFKSVYVIMDQVDFKLNRHNHQQQKDGLPQYMHFVWLLKRFIFGMIPVMIINKGGIQLIFLVLLNEAYTIYIAYTLPNVNFKKNLKNIMSEVLQMAIIYHVILFSDFVVDPEIKFSIGSSQLMFIAILATFNLIVIMLKVLENFKNKKVIKRLRSQLEVVDKNQEYSQLQKQYYQYGLQIQLMRLGVDIQKERNDQESGENQKAAERDKVSQAKAREVSKEVQENIQAELIKGILNNNNDKSKETHVSMPDTQTSFQEDLMQNIKPKTKSLSKNRLSQLKNGGDVESLKSQSIRKIASAKTKKSLKSIKEEKSIRPLNLKNKSSKKGQGTALDTVNEETEMSLAETARDNKQTSSKKIHLNQLQEDEVFIPPKTKDRFVQQLQDFEKYNQTASLKLEKARLMKLQAELTEGKK